MGWLGWTEADTLATTMASILLAYEGRIDLLKSIFGGGDPGSPGQAGGRPGAESKTTTPKTKATPDRIRGALRMLGGAGRGKPKPKRKT